ncbi:hypothetical protein CAPTEDRAFT_211118 [Capitella teleta]|uniref:Retrotransposon gag domain-containing protein n=1 Tax=Capitella teleta TaxID=283909 RepID=R7TW87_CAPTE|nr:hypothetical protein CAPTEDRAFT_211118 [Capitella teleta]|eukprot:ELT95250.1 hypothetical protein CAPTEDRAFT_211118 [Capitella teleta]
MAECPAPSKSVPAPEVSHPTVNTVMEPTVTVSAGVDADNLGIGTTSSLIESSPAVSTVSFSVPLTVPLSDPLTSTFTSPSHPRSRPDSLLDTPLPPTRISSVITVPDVKPKRKTPKGSHLAGSDKQAMSDFINTTALTRDAVKRVGRCSGEKPTETLKWLRAIDECSQDRTTILWETSEGPLREFIKPCVNRYEWADLKQWVAERFISTDFTGRQQRALRELKQRADEPIEAAVAPTFCLQKEIAGALGTTCYSYFLPMYAAEITNKSAMDDAYPTDNNKNPEQHKILVRLYGRCLNSKGKAGYMMANGRPDTIEGAMVRTQARSGCRLSTIMTMELRGRESSD